MASVKERERDREAQGSAEQPLLSVIDGDDGGVERQSDPATYFGANPAAWVSGSVPSLSLTAIGEASAGLVTAAAVPIRWAALSSLSGEVARLTVSAGEVAATALIDLSTSGPRASRSYGDAYEDAI